MSNREKSSGESSGFSPEKVDELLDTGGGFMDDIVDEATARWQEADANRWVGRRLGPFQVIEYLDRGGMSMVFRAERRDGQYEQQVAIKVLQTNNGSELAKRFVRERQLLARLEHPGIARILDSGVFDTQPWIAMELVDGMPIDSYCDHHQLDVDSRLRLFIQVACAVQFAHGRLIVHRDIKPGNVLVDTDGRCKLLDFGIAKAMHDDGEAKLTGAAMLLTPQYASPEQVLGDSVGVASDVYQLGLLLYRLLTGCNAQTIDKLSVAKISSVVIEEEPLPVSERVETTGAQDTDFANSVAAARSTSLSKLSKTLYGDLDIIVAECLKKSPADRYSSIEKLIEDIAAYRNFRPIQARSPNAWYKTSRFVRRNRGSVASGVLTLAVLIGALVVTGLSLRSTIQAQDQALAEAAAAQAVGDFLADMLEQANPTLSGGEELTVSMLLEQSAPRLATFEEQPRVRARLLEVIAGAYIAMHLPESAEPLAKEALETREELGDVAGSVVPLTYLAIANTQQGDLDDARVFGERAVDAAGNVMASSYLRASSHNALATVLAMRGEYTQERAQLLMSVSQLTGIDSERARVLRANGLMKLGSNSRQQADYETARTEFESALAALANNPAHLATRMFVLRELGTLNSNMGDELQAIEMLQQSLELARQVYGSESANILGNLVLLGRSLGNMNRIEESEPLFVEALSIAEATIGKDHGNYARILHDYAEILRRSGDFQRVRIVRDQAVRIADAFFGRDHSTAVNLRKARAFVEIDEGRYPQALIALDEVIPDVEAAFGNDHMITFGTHAFRAQALLNTNKIPDARELMSTLEAAGQQIAGGQFYSNERNLIQLSHLYRLTGPLDMAYARADQVVSQRREIDGGGELTMLAPLIARIQAAVMIDATSADADITQALALLAENPNASNVQLSALLADFAVALAYGGHPSEARLICTEATSKLESLLRSDQPLLAYARINCAHVALRLGDSKLSQSLLVAALPVVTETLGVDNWQTLLAVALLETATDRPEQRHIALSKLQGVLGDESPLLRRLKATAPN